MSLKRETEESRLAIHQFREDYELMGRMRDEHDRKGHNRTVLMIMELIADLKAKAKESK